MEEEQNKEQTTTHNLSTDTHARINNTLSSLEQIRYYLNINQGNVFDLKNFWATIELGFLQIKTLLNKKEAEEYLETLKILEKAVNQLVLRSRNTNGTIPIPVKVFNDLKELHMKILLWHQNLGLGLHTTSKNEEQDIIEDEEWE